MEARHIIAYAIIAVIVLILLGSVLYARNNTRERKNERARERHRESRKARTERRP